MFLLYASDALESRDKYYSSLDFDGTVYYSPVDFKGKMFEK